MILAIEMTPHKADRTPYPWQQRRGLKVYEYALRHEVLLRPLGNIIYFMPPYVITPADIDLLARVATDGIHLATRD
jgi:adenosylmethionine-8-amino-7-oxononanoate aminotransferase